MFKQSSNNLSGSWKMILLFILAGAAVLMISPVSAYAGVTIAAQGDQSYYLGEKVIFSGHNYDSDSTYLLITGPGIPNGGGKLTSPQQDVVSGNPGSFTVVKTKPDNTWEYAWYTSNVTLDAGTYTVYAVSQPKAQDQPDPAAASVKIIVKKPFITAGISPAIISKGVPFSVTGTAEGIPAEVQIWIIGDDFANTTKTPVNSTTALFTYAADAAMSGKLPAGQYYIIVQHSMADNQFDFAVSGDYVRNLKLNNGTIIFKLTGPGSLQGSDGADALIAAISDQEANDLTLTNDTYTIVPFQVTDGGSPVPHVTASATAAVESPAHPALLPSALIGAIVLVLGIVVWKRH